VMLPEIAPREHDLHANALRLSQGKPRHAFPDHAQDSRSHRKTL
jgi:hypothetical protein